MCRLPCAICERFAPYDPYWIEEPFSPDQIDNHAKLAAAISIPVATGEIEAGRWRFKELLDKQAASILQADAAVCGGITEFRRIAALADCYGVTMCPHWFHDLHVHLVAASPNGQFVEYFPDGKVFNFCEIIDRQLEVRDGGLALPVPARPRLSVRRKGDCALPGGCLEVVCGLVRDLRFLLHLVKDCASV
jgi:L-alanine-DL-glutamate epimerase-like enolase superfamily enzyme